MTVLMLKPQPQHAKGRSALILVSLALPQPPDPYIAIQETVPLLQPTSSPIPHLQALNPVKDMPVQPRSKPPAMDQLLDSHHLEVALQAV